MTIDTLTPELLHILQHSLGLDQYGQGNQYRNRFCAGGKDVEHCRELVRLGYMQERGASELTGGNPSFTVTPAGIEAVKRHSPKQPKVSRAKQRYQRYLDSDGSFDSFKDFLHYEAAKARQERAL